MKRLPVGLLVLLCVVAVGLVAQETTVLKVKVQSANVRSEPDMNAAVVKQVRLGTLLESRQKIGEWFEVTITDERGNTMSGFVNSSVVDVVSGGAAKPAVQQPEVKKPVEAPPTVYAQPQIQQAPAAPQGPFRAGGFKIFGGLGMGNFAVTWPAGTDAETISQFNKYKQGRMGYNAGIGLEFGSRISAEIDLLYVQKGVLFKGTANDPTYGNVTFDFNVLIEEISLPFLVKFHVLASDFGPDVYLMGGGEAAYVMGGKSKYSYTQAGQTQTGSEDIKKEDLNSLDYGAVFGAGAGLNLAGIKVFVEGRYHLGMASLEKSNAPSAGGEDVKPKSSLFLFLVGFKF